MTFEDKFHEAEKGAEARADAERQRKHTGSQANTQLPRELAPDQPISEIDEILNRLALTYYQPQMDKPKEWAKAKAKLEAYVNRQIVAELKDIKNVCMMPYTTVSGINRVVGMHIARLAELSAPSNKEDV